VSLFQYAVAAPAVLAAVSIWPLHSLQMPDTLSVSFLIAAKEKKAIKRKVIDKRKYFVFIQFELISEHVF
jgi:hypothetical protein